MKKRMFLLFLLLFLFVGCNSNETTTLYTGQTTTANTTTPLTGVDGREIELRVSDDTLEWRYVGEVVWNDLYNLDNLEGVGIKSAIINDLGELVITYTDDSTVNLGEFNKLNLVQFVDALGNIISVQLVMDGDSATEPTPPEIEGHNFSGWSTTFDNITDDLIVYGFYTPEYYSLTFDSQGGSDLGVWGFDYGVRVNLPVPERPGYLFLGWYTASDVNSPKIENGFIMNQDITLYARWQKTTAITVNSEEELLSALADYSYQEIYFGSDITVSEALVINADRPISIYGNNHKLMTKDNEDLFSIIDEYYYEVVGNDVLNFGYLRIYDLDVIAENDIYGFDTEYLFNLENLNGYILSLDNVTLTGEAEYAINLYKSRNINVILTDSVIDVVGYGLSLNFVDGVSMIAENAEIRAISPIYLMSASHTKMVSRNSLIVTKANESKTFAIETHETRLNDLSFINTYFDTENLSNTSIVTSSQEMDNQYFGFINCVFDVNIPIFDDLFYSEVGLSQHMFVNGTIIIKEGVTIIPASGFGNADNITSIILPSTLEVIENFAFASCNNLTSIVIPEGVESIGNEAFAGDVSLISVVIPSTVNDIGTNVFIDANPYLNIYVLSGADYTAWPVGWNGLSLVDTWVIEVGDLDGMTYVALNDRSVRIIGYNAFEINDLIIPESITIDEDIYTVKQIMPFAFGFNNTLRSIVIPDTVIEIAELAFYSSHALETVEFSVDSNLLLISDYAFYDCISLKSIIIPRSVAYLGYYAFANNMKLESIEFESGSLIEEIRTGTFMSDMKLKTITIPAAVTLIGQYAFNNSQSLSLVLFEEGSMLNSIGSYAFYSCSSLNNFILPDTVTEIGEYAFGFARNMTAFTISDTSNLTTIGNNAFFYNTSLLEINLVNGITSIGDSAFSYNFSMTEVTLPAGIPYISQSAFSYCKNLVTVNIPEGSLISEVRNYAFEGNESLEYINLPDNVVRIGTAAFRYCNSLVKMYIPSAVMIIDDMAFYLCENLHEVIFSDVENLTHIGQRAFAKCYNLARFFIPDSVTIVEGFAFEDSLDTIIYVEAASIPGTWDANWGTDAQTPILNASYIRCIQNNGDDLIMIYAVVGDTVSSPVPTIYEGYVFDDWYIDILTDYVPYVFTVMPDEAVTVYAEWDPLI